MPKLVQGKTKDFGFLGIEEEGSQFGFSGGCSNQFEDGASDVNCTVQFDWITIDGYTVKEGNNHQHGCGHAGQRDTKHWNVR